MEQYSEGSSDILSIEWCSDDLPICEPFAGTKRIRSLDSSSSSQPTVDSSSDAESEPDQVIEPDSVTDLYPEINDFLNGATCDVDQLVLHGYPVRFIIEDFPCDNFVLEPKVHKHRAFTEKAAAATRQSGSGYLLNTTDLFLGTLGGYQVVIEKITSM